MVETFPILGQPTASIEPADGSLHDPAFRQHHELSNIGAFDDLDINLTQNTPHRLSELRSLVARIGIKFPQKWKQTEQRTHHQHPTVAVLNIRAMHNRVQQKALRIYENVTLLAFDLLARVIARKIN